MRPANPSPARLGFSRDPSDRRLCDTPLRMKRAVARSKSISTHTTSHPSDVSPCARCQGTPDHSSGEPGFVPTMPTRRHAASPFARTCRCDRGSRARDGLLPPRRYDARPRALLPRMPSGRLVEPLASPRRPVDRLASFAASLRVKLPAIWTAPVKWLLWNEGSERTRPLTTMATSFSGDSWSNDAAASWLNLRSPSRLSVNSTTVAGARTRTALRARFASAAVSFSGAAVEVRRVHATEQCADDADAGQELVRRASPAPFASRGDPARVTRRRPQRAPRVWRRRVACSPGSRETSASTGRSLEDDSGPSSVGGRRPTGPARRSDAAEHECRDHDQPGPPARSPHCGRRRESGSDAHVFVEAVLASLGTLGAAVCQVSGCRSERTRCWSPYSNCSDGPRSGRQGLTQQCEGAGSPRGRGRRWQRSRRRCRRGRVVGGRVAVPR